MSHSEVQPAGLEDLALKAADSARVLITIQQGLVEKIIPERISLNDRVPALLEPINAHTKTSGLVVVFEDNREIDPSGNRPESSVRASYLDPADGTLHYVPSQDDLGFMDTLEDQHLFGYISRKLEAAMVAAWSNLSEQEKRQITIIWASKKIAHSSEPQNS